MHSIKKIISLFATFFWLGAIAPKNDFSALQQSSTTFKGDIMSQKKVFLDVPYLNQDKLVSGCEAVSATMVLKFWGYNISEEDFYDNYILHKDWKYCKNGHMCAADPSSAYVGNARKSKGLNCGFGCYAPVLTRALNKAVDNTQHKVINKTGEDLSYLCSEYLNNGIPVIIYATIGMQEPKPTCKWRVSFVNADSKMNLNDIFTWIAHEHCLVLTGYDSRFYFLNDPYKNRGKIAVEKKLLEKRFGQMGKMSVVIIPKD